MCAVSNVCMFPCISKHQKLIYFLGSPQIRPADDPVNVDSESVESKDVYGFFVTYPCYPCEAGASRKSYILF